MSIRFAKIRILTTRKSKVILLNWYICFQSEQMKYTHQVAYEIIDHWNELPMIEQELIAAAYKCAESAYAPYSNFHVGASVLLDDGTIHTGSNQENIAYPSGMCAERVALYAVGANSPNNAITTLVVVAKGDLVKPEAMISPCGSCRQVMAQSEARQQTPIRILLVAQNNAVSIFYRASDLLIFPFGMNTD